MKKMMNRLTVTIVAIFLVLMLGVSALADTTYTSDGFMIPPERIGGARPNLQEPEDEDPEELQTKEVPDETGTVNDEATAEQDTETGKNQEALDDENVEGLVVVEKNILDEEKKSEEQTEVRTNNADIEQAAETEEKAAENTDELASEVSEISDVENPAEITDETEKTDEEIPSDDGEDQDEQLLPEDEISYLQDEEGNLIQDENGNPITYIKSEETADEETKITYQKDEDGNLVLDESGEPIPIVPEGMEIPVRYQRNKAGKLVLDENGDPVCIETIGAGSQKVMDIYDLLDPNRSVSMYFYYFGKKSVWLGEPVQMIAVPKGYDNVPYSFQWQYSKDGENWNDCPGETGKTMTVEMTMENCMNWWRVQIILDIPE